MDNKLERQYRSLVELLNKSETKEDVLTLFQEVDGFLNQNLGLAPVLAYSYSKKLTKDKERDLKYSFRVIWPRNLSEFGYKEKVIKEFLKYIDDSNISETKLIQLELEGINFLGFFCGENEHQYYIGVTKIDDPSLFNKTLFDYVVEFSEINFKKMENYKDLLTENSLIDVDDVTGLFNSRRLHKDIDFAIGKHARTGEPFAILFIDIDHFKNVNDGHGHLVGTQLLADMAAVLKIVLRETDYLYRYGGDEFVIIVPGADTPNAKNIGERVLNTVKEKLFGDKKFKLSVSIGIASYPKDADSSAAVMALADQMMYQAKSQGRGKVCLATDLFDKK